MQGTWHQTKFVKRPPAKKVKKLKLTMAKPKLVKQTTKNTKDIKLLKSVGFQYAPFVLKASGVLSNAIHVALITAPNTWGGIFRMHGVSDEDLPRQYNLKSINIDWACQCEAGDVGNLWVQTLVVSLKAKTASQVLERTTRLSNMTENLDYTAMSAGTAFALQGSLNYKLNPNLYTVHYNSGQRRIGEATMGETPVSVTNINNGTTMGSCTVKFPRVFKNDETSDAGFKDLNYEAIEPKQHLYLITFSNTSGNIVTGGELFHTSRCQFNGHCNNPN